MYLASGDGLNSSVVVALPTGSPMKPGCGGAVSEAKYAEDAFPTGEASTYAVGKVCFFLCTAVGLGQVLLLARIYPLRVLYGAPLITSLILLSTSQSIVLVVCLSNPLPVASPSQSPSPSPLMLPLTLTSKSTLTSPLPLTSKSTLPLTSKSTLTSPLPLMLSLPLSSSRVNEPLSGGQVNWLAGLRLVMLLAYLASLTWALFACLQIWLVVFRGAHTRATSEACHRPSYLFGCLVGVLLPVTLLLLTEQRWLFNRQAANISQTVRADGGRVLGPSEEVGLTGILANHSSVHECRLDTPEAIDAWRFFLPSALLLGLQAGFLLATLWLRTGHILSRRLIAARLRAHLPHWRKWHCCLATVRLVLLPRRRVMPAGANKVHFPASFELATSASDNLEATSRRPTDLSTNSPFVTRYTLGPNNQFRYTYSSSSAVSASSSSSSSPSSSSVAAVAVAVDAASPSPACSTSPSRLSDSSCGIREDRKLMGSNPETMVRISLCGKLVLTNTITLGTAYAASLLRLPPLWHVFALTSGLQSILLGVSLVLSHSALDVLYDWWHAHGSRIRSSLWNPFQTTNTDSMLGLSEEEANDVAIEEAAAVGVDGVCGERLSGNAELWQERRAKRRVEEGQLKDREIGETVDGKSEQVEGVRPLGRDDVGRQESSLAKGVFLRSLVSQTNANGESATHLASVGVKRGLTD
ncbi:unnamed protein product [Protopolystoma xenopodis]|uniref:G-protein coupled receptors family 2 profile 2 domain-containing protein n=1 Tax=Protopolystoma xenopodis TaxID=117903 RepID=A0A448WEL6_9PLAT|nr:unnamed protein product [Protopolystoma xenopodis]